MRASSIWVIAIVVGGGAIALGLACSSSGDSGGGVGGGASDDSGPGQGTASSSSSSGVSSGGGQDAGDPNDPGPPPTKQCTVTKDGDGFFPMTVTAGGVTTTYTAFVPKSYDATNKTPMPLIVGAHGCGDNAYNFATWAVNTPTGSSYTRDNQTWIGISVENTDNGGCWVPGDDDAAKLLAAVDDISSCFYVHQKHVTVAGYSSGGSIAYYTGLKYASRFDGILIEDSCATDLGANEGPFETNAAWRINIAHIAHQDDGDYPLAQVQADWLKIQAAGFPLQTSVVAGTHDGTGDDWANFLAPKTASWKAP